MYFIHNDHMRGSVPGHSALAGHVAPVESPDDGGCGLADGRARQREGLVELKSGDESCNSQEKKKNNP